MRVRFGGEWIADSQDAVLLHEPGRYPVAYFPRTEIAANALEPSARTSEHRDLGPTSWYIVRAGGRSASTGAWEHTALPPYADELHDHIAFAWRAMDAFYEEDERILGHAADRYHRIDIRQTSRRLAVLDGERTVADTTRPLVLYESGFAPRWYTPREDVDEAALTLNKAQTFCPYKGVCTYYDIGDVHKAAWSYRQAYTEVTRVSDLISFEPDKVAVLLDGERTHLEPGQRVIPHGVDRGLTLDELSGGGQADQPPSAASSRMVAPSRA